MRYTQLRGLARLKMQTLLTFACMNLKQPAKWKHIKGELSPIIRFLCCFRLFLGYDEGYRRLPIPLLLSG